ncbi:cupin domain-containing protein [soil metagenome]
MARRPIHLAAAIASGAVLISATLVMATSGSGVVNVSTRGDGNVSGRTKVNVPGEIKLEAKRGMRVFDQELTLQPGGYVGWHTHPGPVLVTVKTGAFRYQEADCTYEDFTAGQTFVDEGGEHVHNGRNPGTIDSDLSITYLLPLGTAPRIDVAATDPRIAFAMANCP